MASKTPQLANSEQAIEDATDWFYAELEIHSLDKLPVKLQIPRSELRKLAGGYAVASLRNGISCARQSGRPEVTQEDLRIGRKLVRTGLERLFENPEIKLAVTNLHYKETQKKWSTIERELTANNGLTAHELFPLVKDHYPSMDKLMEKLHLWRVEGRLYNPRPGLWCVA